MLDCRASWAPSWEGTKIVAGSCGVQLHLSSIQLTPGNPKSHNSKFWPTRSEAMILPSLNANLWEELLANLERNLQHHLIRNNFSMQGYKPKAGLSWNMQFSKCCDHLWYLRRFSCVAHEAGKSQLQPAFHEAARLQNESTTAVRLQARRLVTWICTLLHNFRVVFLLTTATTVKSRYNEFHGTTEIHSWFWNVIVKNSVDWG